MCGDSLLKTTDGGKAWKETTILKIDYTSGLDYSLNNLQVPTNKTAYVLCSGTYVYKFNDNWSAAVEETKENNVFTISPNPTSEYIEISCSPSREGAGGVSFEIYNVFGTKVEHPPTPSFHEGELRVDVSGLAAGVYFVRVGSKTKRFVVIR